MPQQNSIELEQPINIRPADWRRLPAFYKKVIDGVPSVLVRRGLRAAFVPVRFVHTGIF
ncbi:hypothetical protein [Diaphorobacter sp. MNS-0]|jgi:hypothetical protein|uniref:hypothetical protein n=1 Tax=Diaphorobacter sp. MNS-0 TaxID=2866628 RepID=UPI001C72F352|nr:hypothetical protein [Diaphorobacter sp. MNS-0]QYY27500.1 hypothetical protein K2L43_18750 [Diaphorobacter sp. MNS-0]